MRFKKLRIFMSIALVLFILIIGSIIVIGLIQKAGLDNNDSGNAAIINTDKYPSTITNSQQQPVVQPSDIAPSQPTTVFHPRIVTSAS